MRSSYYEGRFQLVLVHQQTRINISIVAVIMHIFRYEMRS